MAPKWSETELKRVKVELALPPRTNEYNFCRYGSGGRATDS